MGWAWCSGPGDAQSADETQDNFAMALDRVHTCVKFRMEAIVWRMGLVL